MERWPPRHFLSLLLAAPACGVNGCCSPAVFILPSLRDALRFLTPLPVLRPNRFLFLLLPCWLLGSPFTPRAHAQTGQPWVATTDTHTAVVHADGTLWTWGANGNGQLGDGTATDRLTPARVGADSAWQRVAVSNGNTFALKRDGSLWSWGANRTGQLGAGSGNAGDQAVPARVGTGTDWVSVTAGDGFAMALRRDGTLWAWGANYDGQLGDGSTRPRPVPVPVAGGYAWRHVAAGAYHTVAVRQDGTLWAWGYNGQGQLGNGTQTGFNHGNAPTAVPQQVGTARTWVAGAAGVYASGAVQQDGTVWTWGFNYFVGAGLGSQLTPQPVALPAPARSLALGRYTTLIVACDGTLWGYGLAHDGELGDGTYAPRPLPGALTPGHAWTQVVAGQEPWPCSRTAACGAGVPTYSGPSGTPASRPSPSSPRGKRARPRGGRA